MNKKHMQATNNFPDLNGFLLIVPYRLLSVEHTVHVIVCHLYRETSWSIQCTMKRTQKLHVLGS